VEVVAVCGLPVLRGGSSEKAEAARTVRVMCDAIVHRGPDDAGYLVAPEVALGMRRLSIIDVAGGQQPIANEDGSIQVVFNGEIWAAGDQFAPQLVWVVDLAVEDDLDRAVLVGQSVAGRRRHR